MKLRAQQMGSMKALRESLKKGGSVGGDTWIKNIPADGITVRFLTEPEQWFGYQEYWDDANKAFVPMAEGEVTPDGVRPSFRYLANALDVDSDRVVALKLPKTAANVLILKYDKYDTMMDRNYELQKHGEGIDTTYDVTPDAPSKMNLSKYEMHDLYDVLVSARERAIGEQDIDAKEPVAEGASTATKTKAPAPVDVDDDVDNDTDDDVDAHDYSPYTEDELFPNNTLRWLDGGEPYTLAELQAMSEFDLGLIVAELGIEMGPEFDGPDGMAKIMRAIIANQPSGVGDDEPSSDDGDDDDDDDDDTGKVDLDDLLALDIRALRVMAVNLGINYRRLSKEQVAELIYEQS